MNRKLGSRNGKYNKRLFLLNRHRKIKLQNNEFDKKKKKDEQEKKHKEQLQININNLNKEIFESISINHEEKNQITDNNEKEKNYDLSNQSVMSNEIKIKQTKGKSYVANLNFLKENNNSITDIKNSTSNLKNLQDEIINLDDKYIEKQTNDFDLVKDKNIIHPSSNDIQDEIINLDDKYIEKQINDFDLVEDKDIIHPSSNDIQDEIINLDDKYIEKQIIKILENKIDEDRYELKKIDNEIFNITKMIDSIYNEEEIEETEKRIEILLEQIENIKRKIESLKKTFNNDLPIEEPDNYIIYLINEYQDKRKLEQKLTKNLKQDQEYKSLMDEIIEVEKNNNELKKQIILKKEKYLYDDEQVNKITKDIDSIENIQNKITETFIIQTKLLEKIKQKVDETVQINERINVISKTINHSILDLILLMAIFKHNLSLKNDILAAVSAKIVLDMIIKMTTPFEEKITIKESTLIDYQAMITACLDDTSNLENLIDSNINDIESIRYKFEYNYNDCAYLDSYQEALSKLISLENEMNNRKKAVINMKKETMLQLEKNNEKVRKYSEKV